MRIGKGVFDHAADAREQLVRGTRDGRTIGWSKQRADEIVDGQLHVEIGRRKSCFAIGTMNEVEQQTASAGSVAANTTLRLEAEMGLHRLPRQPKGQPLRVSVTAEIFHGPRRIDERNIADSELHGPIDLGQGRPPGDLKQNEIMVRAKEANIFMRPL